MRGSRATARKRSTVVNLHTNSYDVYIGRGSKWGNPFRLHLDGDREQVIAKYREWIQRQPELMNSLEELRGKRLGCYCALLPCHGDILVELLEAKEKK